MPTLPNGGQVVPEWAKALLTSTDNTLSKLSAPVISNGVLYAALRYAAVLPQQLNSLITLPATSTDKYCIICFDMVNKSVSNIIYLPSSCSFNILKCIDAVDGYIYIYAVPIIL